MNEVMCTKCKKILPLNTEYFRAVNTKRGFRSECKKCESEYSKKKRPNYYFNIKKELDVFVKGTYTFTTRIKKPEDVLQKEREIYSKTTEYKQKKRIRDKKYRTSSKGKLNSMQNGMRRRTKKKNLPSTYTKEEWFKCLEHFNNECAYCGKKIKLSQDHFVSLNKGGAYTKNNIVPSCKNCNSSKRDRKFEEWYLKQDFYSKERKNKIFSYLGQ